MHTQHTAQLIACMQDLQRKEGGGDSKAEELADGTATKAGTSLHRKLQIMLFLQHVKPGATPPTGRFLNQVLWTCSMFASS